MELKIRRTDVIVSLERRAREFRIKRAGAKNARIETREGTRKNYHTAHATRRDRSKKKKKDLVAAVSPRGYSSKILDRTEIWTRA